MFSIEQSKETVGVYTRRIISWDAFRRAKEEQMNLLKPLRRPKDAESTPPKGKTLFLSSEHAECTCPEPCERDHGNE
jgi:hypothetical protein